MIPSACSPLGASFLWAESSEVIVFEDGIGILKLHLRRDQEPAGQRGEDMKTGEAISRWEEVALPEKDGPGDEGLLEFSLSFSTYSILGS